MANRTTERPMPGQFLLILGCLQILSVCSCNKQSPVSNVVFVDSPCILAAKPSEYGEHEIKVLAHIWSTREGAFIWGDGCKYPGIRLHFSEALTRDAKFQLNQGTATTLVKATLIGKFRYKRFTSLRALVFGDKTFEAEQVIEPQFDSTNGAFASEGKTPTNTLPHESGHAATPPRPQ